MNASQIQETIKTKRLQLSRWQRINHYSVSFAFPVIPLVLLVQLSDWPTQKEYVQISLIVAAFFALAFLYYKLQSMMLNFIEVETKLSIPELKKIIDELAINLNWSLVEIQEQFVIAETPTPFYAVGLGERVTIVFDKNKVLINSIRDPKTKSTMASISRNRRNVSRLIDKIRQAE